MKTEKHYYLIVRDNPYGYLDNNGEIKKFYDDVKYYETEKDALESLEEICEDNELNKNDFYVIEFALNDDLNSNDISCGD